MRFSLALYLKNTNGKNQKGHYMKLLKYILLAASFINSALWAQFASNIEISSYYDDNLYRSPVPTEDLLTSIDLNLSYRLEDSNFRLFYNGNFFLYRDISDQSFSLNGIGLNYFSPLGDEDLHLFYLGLDGTLRINKEEFNYYDYSQLYAYTNLRFDLDFLFLKVGYNFRYRDYSNIPELKNFRHYVFAQVNKSFLTRTTIILETDLGHKSFASQESYLSNDSDGRGHGYMAEGYITTFTSEIPSMSQVVFLARITQSLFQKMGLYIQYRTQMSLTDQASYINSDSYFKDEELFDDPFSYEGRGLSSQLTWLMPWAMKVQIGGSLISKNYISEQAYTSAEDTSGLGGARADERSSLYIDFSKTIILNKYWANSIRFSLYYNYTDNQSNSYWYNYKNNVIGGGLEWRF
jgi:hypothetical protein